MLDIAQNGAQMSAAMSSFRSYLAQVLACSAKNLILFQILQALSFSTVIVTDLLNTQSDGLYLTSTEASWFVSITYLCEPLGSLVSGFIIGPFGRKKVMLALNVPMFCAWLMIHFASNVAVLYVASAIFGICIGCSQAPVVNYVGEISQPKLRGILCSYSQVFCGLAYFFVYLLGSFYSWRMTALISSTVPVVNVLALLMIPESPIWLIQKNRRSEAEKSLKWLRGWTQSENIREEMIQMESYCAKTLDSNSNTHSSKLTLKGKFRYFIRREMIQPLTIVTLYFGAMYGSGFSTMLPYVVTVFPELGIGQDVNKASVIVSIANIVGYIACMSSITFVGKRILTFASLLGSAVSTLILAAVAARYLSSDWSYPIFLIFTFFSSIGTVPLPWVLQSEIYPRDGKEIASGIGATMAYVIGFVATNTYLKLQGCLGLCGVLLFYSALSVLFSVYFYFFLPETEGKTFEEIEKHFKKK